MDAVNEKYWYEQWHLDYELHSKLGVPLTREKKDDKWNGKSFDCNKGYKEKLEDILDGKYPAYETKKLRKRLLLVIIFGIYFINLFYKRREKR